jgi:hypothetical protein
MSFSQTTSTRVANLIALAGWAVLAGSVAACGSGPAPTVSSPSALPGESSVSSFVVSTADLGSCLASPSASCFSGARRIAAQSTASASLVGAPQRLSSFVQGSTVGLSWGSVSGAVGFLVEAGSAPGLANLASVPAPLSGNYVANGVPNGTYYVRVRAVDSSGTPGPPSNEVIVGVGPTPCIPPTALTIATNVGGSVGLRWAAATGATSYILEAGTAPGLSNIASIDVGSQPTFVANGVPIGTYYLRVRARNACGVSSPSNEATLVVTAAPPPGGDK